MPIQIGERIPEVVLQRLTDDGVQQVDTHAIFEGKNVLLFAVPGAFTPTCSERHLPGYVEQHAHFAERGIVVACMSVNDPFVMKAWGQSQSAPDAMLLLADGNGDFTRALGLQMDASAFGMGQRSKRFALYAENGIVKDLQVEAPGELRVSSAEAMLERMPQSATIIPTEGDDP